MALFNQSVKRAQEIRREVQAEHESKGKEYDTQHMKEFHKVFDEVYPGYFHNTYIVSASNHPDANFGTVSRRQVSSMVLSYQTKRLVNKWHNLLN
jgi:hypothetical protein